MTFLCPHCGSESNVTAVQGDRCAACCFEYKRFGPDEKHLAEDYFAILTGQKHLLRLPDGLGWIVAHE